MPHTMPDWGQYSGSEIISPTPDLGELAARLGGVNLFDRRGNTIWWDDFESGLNKWLTSVGASPSAIAWSNEAAHMGRYCVKLTTGAGGTQLAQMTHYQPLLVKSACGIEFAISRSGFVGTVEIFLYYRGVNELISSALRLNIPQARIEYLPDVGDWQTLISPVYFESGVAFMDVVKLVADFDGLKYRRAIWDGDEVAMDQALKTQWIASGAPVLYVQINKRGDGTGTSSVYIDDIIITVNEP